MNVALALIIVFLLFLIQRTIYIKYWDRQLDVGLAFSEESTREGRTLTLHESISNRKFLPLTVFRVKFAVSRYLSFANTDNSQVSDLYYRNDILSVMMYQKITRSLDFTCTRRGYYTIDRIDTVCSDIFMSANIVNVLPCRLQLYVYPRLIEGEPFNLLFRQMFGTVLTRRLINEDPFEFRGIREYQPYDSLKTVNFTASAKTGELKVNQHAPTSSKQVRLLLNLELETLWRYDDLLEEALRLVSTFASAFLAEGVPVSLLSNGLDRQTGQPVALEAGSGNSHLKSIDESLARIDTASLSASFLPSLTELSETGTDDTLILISTFQRQDFAEAVNNLYENGCSLFWIVPLHQDMELTVPDYLSDCVIRWDINPQA